MDDPFSSIMTPGASKVVTELRMQLKIKIILVLWVQQIIASNNM